MIIPSLGEDTDNLSAAAQYAQAGIYVLPVKPGTKHPGSRAGDRWQDKSSRDTGQIVAWLAGSSDGLAIDLGRSGLIAIDVDHPEQLPEWLRHVLITSGAPYQQTRPNSAGRGHYLFAQPPGRRIGCGKGALAGMGLDVKGAGGVIIVEPTVHPAGGEYKWIVTGEVPVLPMDIAEKLGDTEQAESAATDIEVTEFVRDMVGQDNPKLLSTWSAKFTAETARLGSRHDAMVSVLTAAMEEARAGYFPARDATDILREMFVVSVIVPNGSQRLLTEAQAHAEFSDMLPWAIAQAKSKPASQIREKTEKGIAKSSDEDSEILSMLAPQKPARAQPPQEGGESPPEAHTNGIPAICGQVRMTLASSIASASPTWAWHYNGAGRIQLGTLTILAGRPAAGKSTAARWFAAGYSTGRIPGCFLGDPVNVAYIGTEESYRYVVKPSLDGLGANTERIAFPTIESDEGGAVRIISATHEVALAQAFREANIRIVIVDPIMSTISQNADIHKNNETRLYVEPWARIAESIDGIVMGVAHLNKSGGTDLVAAITGSSAFGEIARSVFGFVKDKQGNRIMSQVKNSTGREDLSVTYEIAEVNVPTATGQEATVATFEITGLSDVTASDAMVADAEPSLSIGKGDATAMWLEDYLTVNSKTRAKEILSDGNKEGFSKTTLYRAAKKLKVETLSEGMPRQSFWKLPDAHHAGTAWNNSL